MAAERPWDALLPPRWLVRLGEPCDCAMFNEVSGPARQRYGSHIWVHVGNVDLCLWCHERRETMGREWTVTNPTTGQLQRFPSHESAVRRASEGWLASLSPPQRAIYRGGVVLRMFERMGLW